MGKLRFIKITKFNMPGYDMKIADPGATIQDMLDELNLFIEKSDIARLWPENTTKCKGCHLCCHEPLPITSIDLKNICRAKSLSVKKAFKYLEVEVEQNIIDITLKRSKDDACIFLSADGICTIYQHRPFACQTYICSQTSEAVEETRSRIVNMGMDELIRANLDFLLAAENGLPYGRNHFKQVKAADWRKNVFTGKEQYASIRLRQVIPSDLFKHMLL